MTTAHRPTYNPTRGGNMQGGNKLYNPSLQYSAKDLPGYLTLKRRQVGQGSRKDVLKKNFKTELLQREQKLKNQGDDKGMAEGLISSLYGDSLLDVNESNVDVTSDIFHEPQKKIRLDSDISEVISHEIRNESDIVFPQDKDISFDEDKDDEDEQGGMLKKKQETVDDDNLHNESLNRERQESEEEEDSEEELLREYEKIKMMREEEAKKKEEEANQKLKEQAQEQVLLGNPLINQPGGYSLKKKWFEDTVFKNQSKSEPKLKKRFVNDTVRSDFHRKFLSKSIQ